VDFRSDAAAIRSRRDRHIEAAKAAARRELVELVSARDAEIHTLRAQNLSGERIAAAVGASKSAVYLIVDPPRVVRYRKRRQHARHLKAA
jgi:hypothetical protein